ncbi:MAG: nucleotide exchange factor GrpE [Vulcanibacillus sp.]
MDELEKEKDIVDYNEEASTDKEMEIQESNIEEEKQIFDNEVAQLKEKIEESQNRLMRVQADFDNFRKRTTTEKEDLAKYVNAQLIKSLLPACDNFERAIKAAKENDNLDSLLQGIEMVYRQIEDVLTNEGLKEIESLGKSFNPEYHQAVMQVESEEHEAGVIIEELQKGYLFKGRVIRPSMVKVSV